MAKAKKQNEKNSNEEKLEKEDEQLNNKNSEETVNKTTENTENNYKKEIAAQEELKNLNDRFLRLQADFLNFKTRTEKEKSSTYGNAVSDLILDLLPVIDNLERALSAETDGGSTYKEGVQMVYNQFMGILAKKGLKEVEALHKPFDHNVHYGVGFEACEDHEDGIIIDVLQKGYTVNERCIRPSMVRIAKND